MKHPMTAALLSLGVFLVAGATARAGDDVAPMSPEQFCAALHAMIKRQPGESR